MKKLRYGAVAAIALLALTSCSATSNLDGDRSTVSTIGDESVRLDLPLSGDAKHLAIWFHGQGGDEDQRMNDDWLNALREDGWAVASGSTGRTGWGNNYSVDAAADLVEWAEKESGVEVSLLIAGSMGATTSLRLLAETADPPECWYGTMPVADLDAVSEVPGSGDQISSAWGTETQVSPLDIVDEMPTDVRYAVRFSPEDEWVPSDENGEALAAALEARGASVMTSEASGAHGDPSHFDIDDLSAFAASCA